MKSFVTSETSPPGLRKTRLCLAINADALPAESRALAGATSEPGVHTTITVLAIVGVGSLTGVFEGVAALGVGGDVAASARV